MKKWILLAALFLIFSGYAAAQSKPSTAAPKTEEKKVEKKGTEVKKGSAKNVKENNSQTPVTKIKIPAMPVDTTAVPKNE